MIITIIVLDSQLIKLFLHNDFSMLNTCLIFKFKTSYFKSVSTILIKIFTLNYFNKNIIYFIGIASSLRRRTTSTGSYIGSIGHCSAQNPISHWRNWRAPWKLWRCNYKLLNKSFRRDLYNWCFFTYFRRCATNELLNKCTKNRRAVLTNWQPLTLTCQRLDQRLNKNCINWCQTTKKSRRSWEWVIS